MGEFKLEKTCKCLQDIETEQNDKKMLFRKGREYQVDVFNYVDRKSEYNGPSLSLLYKVYNNGGWYDYITIKQEEFDKYFEIII